MHTYISASLAIATDSVAQPLFCFMLIVLIYRSEIARRVLLSVIYHVVHYFIITVTLRIIRSSYEEWIIYYGRVSTSKRLSSGIKQHR